MNFEAVIGLETHIETNTKSKMFSTAPNLAEQEPNTEVTLLDMAFPGTMGSNGNFSRLNLVAMLCVATFLVVLSSKD